MLKGIRKHRAESYRGDSWRGKVQLGSLNKSPDYQMMENGRGSLLAQVGGVISTQAFPDPWAQSAPARLQLLSRNPKKALASKGDPKTFPALVAAAKLGA